MIRWLMTLALLPTFLGAGLFSPQYDEALTLAETGEKAVLLFFNGSDWSGSGMKLKHEILSSELFESKMKDDLVLYEVDFPKHSVQSEEVTSLHLKLKERYHVDYLPTLLLIRPDEQEIVRLGYVPMTPEQLTSDLKTVCSNDGMLQLLLCRLDTLSVEELLEAYALASRLMQKESGLKILKVGMNSSAPAFFLTEYYCQLAQEGSLHYDESRSIKKRLFALDPNNHEGHFYRLALTDFQTLAAKEGLSPTKVIGPLADYLKQFGGSDPTHSWQIEMLIAEFFLDQDYWNSALRHAEIAHRSAPLEQQGNLEHFVDYIRDKASQTVSN